jgi:hemerythrin superfamily protein
LTDSRLKTGTGAPSRALLVGEARNCASPTPATRKEHFMARQTYTDAIALLKADHRKVEDLFEKFENARAGSKQKLAEEICNELKIHTIIEEEVFYPALKGKIEEDTWTEAYVEHDGAKVLVNDIAGGSSEDEFFDAKVHVLSEEIKHHVREEERRQEGMFAQAREAGVDLIELKDRMLVRKEELMAMAKNGGLPPAQVRVVQV